MKKTSPEEWFPVVDEVGNTISEAPRRICHDGKSMLLHPVVHLHLFNRAGELFLQKRVMTKDIQPGKWDTSVGGHISPGETIDEALIRETEEETGLRNLIPEYLGNYIWESTRERELVHYFSAVTDEIPFINKNEIEEGRFWTFQDIDKNIGKNVFTPNFENEYRKLLSMML